MNGPSTIIYFEGREYEFPGHLNYGEMSQKIYGEGPTRKDGYECEYKN